MDNERKSNAVECIYVTVENDSRSCSRMIPIYPVGFYNDVKSRLPNGGESGARGNMAIGIAAGLSAP